MSRAVVVNIAGLSWGLSRSDAAPTLKSLAGARPMMPSFPAVTSTMQATLTTAKEPAEHGIVANGLYSREYAKVSFWEQSCRLVQAPKIWEIAKNGNPGIRTAMLFWQNSVGSSNDVIITPAPIHKADGRMLSSCYTRPVSLYYELVEKLGHFDLMSYWGPLASIKSSKWIAAASREVFERFQPDLTLIYLPHLDYPLQKLGPDAPEIESELKHTDDLLAEIKEWAEAGGAELIVVSEYGMTAVSGAVMPNRILRDAGLLEVRTVEGMEYLDIPASRAFAMVDHQVAHIYAQPDAIEAARAALCGVDGIDMVLGEEGKADLGINHPRAGELVAVSDPDKWFAYYWWDDDSHAPSFARSVDIHRKPGYDPCELFIDDIASRTISLDTSLVKGSHGRGPDNARHMAFFACPSAGKSEEVIHACDAAAAIREFVNT